MNTRMKKLISVVLVLILVLAAEVTKADVIFGTPTNLGPMVNSSDKESSPSISADGLELYFNSNRPGGSGGADIWFSTRTTKDDEWREPVNLGLTVNSSANEVAPSISADGLALYFCDWGKPRPGGLGESDLWVTTRPTKDSAWGEPVNLGPTVNSPAQDGTPVISADGLELYFESDRPGGFGSDDLLVTTRATTKDAWGEPVNLGPKINSSAWEHCPNISANGLTLFFDLKIPGDLMMTKRATLDSEWSEPVNLGHALSSHYASSISADGAMLYFASKEPGGAGGNDIWQVPILPNEAFKAITQEIFNIYASANMAGDADLWLSLWDENGIKMGPGKPAVVGKSTVGEGKRKGFQKAEYESQIIKVEEAQAAGDLGFARGTYTASKKPKAGGATTNVEGKFLTIFKKQADGSWKIFRDCYNSNVP